MKLQEEKSTKKHGRKVLIQNKFQIIDLLDKQKKYKEMLDETEAYCILLLEEGEFKQVEDNYLWLMNHQGLS